MPLAVTSPDFQAFPAYTAEALRKPLQQLKTMANVDEIARYGKRFVRYFYDPMPRNDDNSGAFIWCLGRRYESQTPRPSTPLHGSPNSPNSLHASSASRVSEPLSSEAESLDSEPIRIDKQAGAEAPNAEAPNEDYNDDGGWPAPFLDDFESRIWMTYRSNFQPISKSQDPRAAAALSFAVRIRQLGQNEGFTSDTGWGCMIRSGQSLLANTLSLIKLGRGTISDSIRIRTRTNCCRMETRRKGGGRARTTISLCRRPKSSILSAPLRRTRSDCMWKASRRMVRPFSYGKMHTVCAPGHTTY
jgi:hypothetical protein